MIDQAINWLILLFSLLQDKLLFEDIKFLAAFYIHGLLISISHFCEFFILPASAFTVKNWRNGRDALQLDFYIRMDLIFDINEQTHLSIPAFQY